jgi:menaquinone-9 beta-reductase
MQASEPITEQFDAVVVGASVAGSTTAALLGQHGARVALIEKSPDPQHYKTLCTHELLASASPVFGRLGILEELEALSAGHKSPDIWTRYGWVQARDTPGHTLRQGLNVRREVLDPIIRGRAAATDGVELRLGLGATELLRDPSGRPCGIVATDRDGQRTHLSARLVVGADGGNSTVAELAGVPAKESGHERFGYAAYFEGVTTREPGRAQFWLLDPDVAYVFPTDGGLHLLAVAPLRTPERLAAFKADREGEFLRVFDALPDGPDLSQARRTGNFLGTVKVMNKRRRAAAPGLAFVGDAAQVSDFVWGTGVGYAVRSGAWLADAAGPVLARSGSAAELDAALTHYRQQHTRELALHHRMTADYSGGRGFNLPERLLFGAGPHDPTIARAMHELGSRERPFQKIVTPRLLARAARVRGARKLSRA